uniref:CN hydrolase domain-containing protein n=1 Tax=Panagrellus redivivus TaxID=6233 RepID=A0A7E4ZQI9_PANRE
MCLFANEIEISMQNTFRRRNAVLPITSLHICYDYYVYNWHDKQYIVANNLHFSVVPETIDKHTVGRAECQRSRFAHFGDTGIFVEPDSEVYSRWDINSSV